MTCQRCEELSNAYVDGELPLLEAVRLALHLRKCPQCATSVAEIRRITQMARGWRQLPALPAPRVPWGRVLAGAGAGVALAVAATGAYVVGARLVRQSPGRFLAEMDGALMLNARVYRGAPRKGAKPFAQVMVHRTPWRLKKADGWREFGETSTQPSRQLFSGIATALGMALPKDLSPVAVPPEIAAQPLAVEGYARNAAFGRGPLFVLEGPAGSPIGVCIVVYTQVLGKWKAAGYATVRYEQKMYGGGDMGDSPKNSEQKGFVWTPGIRELSVRPKRP